jgi:FixJ family two-component response regulator
MPSLSGMDLHDALTRRRPPLAERMVFMTGGRVTPEANRFAATMKGRILEKPFDLAFLQSMVRGRLGI